MHPLALDPARQLYAMGDVGYTSDNTGKERSMPKPRWLTRAVLRPLRVLEAAGPVPRDTFSPEYLYLAQQSKRLALVRALGGFRLRNVLLWPVVAVAVLFRWVDLVLSNALIRSLINEHDLLNRMDPANSENDR
jgi:hypothetical protein